MRQPDINSETFTGWDLSEPAEKLPLKDMVPSWSLPYLTTPKEWANYSSDVIYEADKRIREWIASMKSKWSRNGQDRRYSFTMVVQILGLEEVAVMKKHHATIAKVISYYSTRIMKDTKIKGKRCKTVYVLSAKRLERPPYSLRLRLEQMEGEGVWQNLRMPKDDLEPGHARHPRTDANMQRRSRMAKDRANAVNRQWKSEHRKGEPGSDAR